MGAIGDRAAVKGRHEVLSVRLAHAPGAHALKGEARGVSAPHEM